MVVCVEAYTRLGDDFAGTKGRRQCNSGWPTPMANSEVSHFDALNSAWQHTMQHTSNGAIAMSGMDNSTQDANGGGHDHTWSNSFLQSNVDAMLHQQQRQQQEQQQQRQQQPQQHHQGTQAILNSFAKEVSSNAIMTGISWDNTESVSMKENISDTWPSHDAIAGLSSQWTAHHVHEARGWPLGQREDAPAPNSVESSSTSTLPGTTNARPIPVQSQSESLWQRRLNTKNKELQTLHGRTSAPDDLMGTESLSPTGKVPDQDAHDLSGHHDLTHASPNTLRMLHLEPHMPSDSHAALGSSSLPTVSSSYPTQQNESDSARMKYIDPFSGNIVSQPMAEAGFMLNITASDNQHRLISRSVTSIDDDAKPLLSTYAQSFPTMHIGSKDERSRGHSDGSLRTLASDADGGIFGAGEASSQSCQSIFASSSGSGKGVISKVIVPPAPGVPSDAVDIRTGEAGQMRHVCPFDGCDKHFSTSGHARRHSRVHDSLRPFECPHEGCHATFTRRDNCTQHQRARHKFQLTAHRMGDNA